MKLKSQRNKKKPTIYFSDAIKQIDESIDYNEYSEVNSSDYFKDSLYKAEDEVDKMMSSPLMTNFKKYKNNKLSINLLKKNKELIFNKIKWLNEKGKDKEIIDKNKIKLNSMKKKKKLNKNKSRSLEFVQEHNISTNQKLNLRNENNSILPQINTTNTINVVTTDINRKEELFTKKVKTEKKRKDDKKDILLTVPDGAIKSFSLNEKININKNDNNHYKKKDFYFTQTNKDLISLDNKNKNQDNFNRQSLDSMYLKCIKGLETFEFYEKNDKTKLIFHSYKNKNKKMEKDIYKKDSQMKKFLFENISEFYKNNRKSDNSRLKLKKDSILKLSEKFAYFNRKPLLTLFNCDNKEVKLKNSTLAKLKIKDCNIMKKLENDIRNKNLLMKRLDEDQIKYEKGGYFITIKDKDNDLRNNKFKKIPNSDINNNTGYDNEFFNNIKRIVPYESQQNQYFQ